jgi:hypothetical protein
MFAKLDCLLLMAAFEIPPTLFRLMSLLRRRSAICFVLASSAFRWVLRSARSAAAASLRSALRRSSASSRSSSSSESESEEASESCSDSEDERSGLC